MLLMSGKIGEGTIYELDTYNQQVHEEISCTILTNINTANHHFIFERTNDKIYRTAFVIAEQPSDRHRRNLLRHANGEKDGTPKIIEPLSCDMRGRNPDNPSERGRSNGKYKQRIEMGNNISNTITSVQKDALVAEPNVWKKLEEQGQQIEYKGKLLKEGDGLYLGASRNFFHGGLEGLSRTLKASSNDASVVQNFRIRKFTERECFRLMGVSEADIDKIQQSGVSRTQQYKMAGNSIVVDVLEHIFRKLFVDTGQESQQLSLF